MRFDIRKNIFACLFIDDIFMIRQHGEEKLKEFSKILHSCHPTVKFAFGYSLDKANFLEVEVIRSGYCVYCRF